MFKIALACALTVCSTAFAAPSFSGKWTARSENCTSTFEIRQSADQLVIGQRQYQCGPTITILPAQSFRIVNGSVEYQNKYIGLSNDGIIKFSNVGEGTPNPMFSFSIERNPAAGELVRFTESYNSFYFYGDIRRN